MRFSQRIVFYSKQLIGSAVLFLLLMAGIPQTAFAQGEVSLWGTVSDSSGAAIAGAQVTVTNLETGSTRSLVTDDAGKFNATALNVGHYQVAASKAGFQSDRRSNITLVVGQREEVDLHRRRRYPVDERGAERRRRAAGRREAGHSRAR